MSKPEPKQIDPHEARTLALGVINADKFPVLATIEGDSPRVRPVSPVKIESFTTFIGNLRQYSKTQQIAANPNVELCWLDAEHNQVRIAGTASCLEDEQIISEIWKENPLLKHYLGTPNNPELIIYRVDPISVRFMQEWALEYYDVSFEDYQS